MFAVAGACVALRETVRTLGLPHSAAVSRGDFGVGLQRLPVARIQVARPLARARAGPPVLQVFRR